MIEGKARVHDYFSRLTDEQLLYLYSLYIGEVPSPFHKPKLIDALIQHLQNSNTIQRMVDLLDKQDIECINACYYARNGAFSLMQQALFCRGYTEAYIHRKLINLEERLVLLPLRGESPLRFVINPQVLHRLEDMLQIEQLFPGEPMEEKPPELWLSPPLLAAWLSVLQHRKQLFTGKGYVRRHRIDELQDTFPAFTGDGQYYDRLSHIALELNLLIPSERESTLHHRNIDKLFSLTPAAVLLFSAFSFAEGISSGLLQSLVQLFTFCRDRSFKREYVEGACMLICGCSRETAREILDSLVSRSIVHVEASFACSFAPLFQAYRSYSGGLGKPKAALSKNLHVHIESFKDTSLWYHLYRFSNLVQYDRMIIFCLTRETILSALDSHVSLDDIKRGITEVTSKVIPGTTLRILEDWASAFDSLSLFQGIALSCDQRSARIIERTPDIASLIKFTLAQGVYLFSEEDYGALRSRLMDAGFPFVPHIRQFGGKESSRGEIRKERTFPDLPCELSDASDRQIPPVFSQDGKVLEELKQTVAQTSSSKEIQAELSYRIEERLILSKDQLKKSSKRRRIFEAKGFDYQGKLQLIRQALKSDSDILELKVHRDTEETFLLRAEELVKESSSDIIKGKTIPDERPFSMAVGKLFVVRKIRKPLQLPREEMKDR